MKKLLLSILTIIYLTVSSGVAMEIQYCMGKKAGIDIYQSGEDKCGRCGMTEKKGGCCSDEHKFYKLADAHKNVFNDYNAYQAPAVFINEYICFSERSFSIIPVNILPKGDPPDRSTVPVFIRNRVFRI